VLGRSLLRLGQVVDGALAEVRVGVGKQTREPTRVVAFFEDLAPAAQLHADYRLIQFTVEPADPGLTIDADPELLTLAVMNLLQNAFKSTPPGGRVVLSARHDDDTHVLIEVQDECGGMPEAATDPFKPFGERRGRDRTGLGLGLFIARKAVRAQGGEIQIRNMPGKGCIFAVDIPSAPQVSPGPAVVP
jgi:signal transduction histidine kinase